MVNKVFKTPYWSPESCHNKAMVEVMQVSYSDTINVSGTESGGSKMKRQQRVF